MGTGLAVVAAVLACAAAITGYVHRAVLDPEQFANRAVASLDEPAVREFLGARIAAGAVQQAPDLVAVQPLIRGAATSVTGSAPFRSIFRSAVRDVHRTVFEQDRDTVLLTLPDVGLVVRGALAKLDPAAAAKVGTALGPTVVDEELSTTVAADARRLQDLDGLALLLLGLAFVLAAVGFAVAGGGRRRVVVWFGGALGVAALLGLIALRVVRGKVMGQIGDPQDLAAALGLWDAVLGDLRTVLLLLGLTGAILAAAAASLIRPVELHEPVRRGWGWVTDRPGTEARRALRAAGFLAVGALLVIDPRAVLEFAAIACGWLLVVGAASELLRLTELPIAAAERRAGEDGPHASRLDRLAQRLPLRAIAAGLVAFGVLGILVALVARDGGIAAPPAPAIERCNGHAELCDRTLDKVAFAATHNSMAAASYPDWLFAQQDRGIAAQLADGVHGFLIDTYYGRPAGGRIKTDLQSSTGDTDKFVAEIGQEAFDAALRIRDRIAGAPTGPKAIYLCHGFCELGAVPLATAFTDMRRFLTSHPHDVLVLVVQDAVTPDDFVAAVRAADLERFAYRSPIKPPWPTLRSMIEGGERLVVLAEARTGGATWLRPAFAAMQETPFGFRNPAQLTDPAKLEASCVANRGQPGATLFQVNHWIDSPPNPRPSNAVKVNAYAPLLRRLRTCRAQRALFPNIVAVDFYRQGGVFDVVDTLNGVGGAPAGAG